MFVDTQWLFERARSVKINTCVANPVMEARDFAERCRYLEGTRSGQAKFINLERTVEHLEKHPKSLKYFMVTMEYQVVIKVYSTWNPTKLESTRIEKRTVFTMGADLNALLDELTEHLDAETDEIILASRSNLNHHYQTT